RIEAILSNRTARNLDWRRKVLLGGAGVLALTGPIWMGAAQSPAALPQPRAPARMEFDIASIKLNQSGRAGTDGFQVVHGALTVRNVNLKMLIEAAYGIQGPRILNGPAWLSADRFDVVAKGPASANKEQVLRM